MNIIKLSNVPVLIIENKVPKVLSKKKLIELTKTKNWVHVLILLSSQTSEL